MNIASRRLLRADQIPRVHQPSQEIPTSVHLHSWCYTTTPTLPTEAWFVASDEHRDRPNEMNQIECLFRILSGTHANWKSTNFVDRPRCAHLQPDNSG